MRELVFVDTETTGLNSETDLLVELTYAVEDDDPVTLFFGVKEVPDFIDNLTKFSARKVYDEPAATEEQIETFKKALENQTMVAGNPKFDVGFLEANDLYTAHYRTLDVQSYAMAKFDLDAVPSMKDIRFILAELGYRGLTEPDHSSRNDVLFMREAFRIMRYQF